MDHTSFHTSKAQPELSIIIPAFNEEAMIGQLLAKLFAINFPCDFEVIVVDDGSHDQTRERVLPFMKHNQLRYLRSQANAGKGYALRLGFAVARGNFIIVQDADLEYNPRDILRVIAPLRQGKAFAVFGKRIFRTVRPAWRSPFWWGGKTLTLLSNVLFPGYPVADEAVCYKAFKRELLHSIPLRCKGFEFCPEIRAKLARRKVAVYTVPIRYTPRSISEGKKIRFRHWFQAVYTLLRYRVISDHGPQGLKECDQEVLLSVLAEDSAEILSTGKASMNS